MKSITRRRIISIALSMVMMVTMLFGVSVSVHAAEANQPIQIVRVGYFLIDEFQEGQPGERKSGLGYEYLQKIASVTGWEYVYEYGTLTDLLSKLANGEIDIMGDLSYTEERAELFNYSEYTMGKEEYWLYTIGDESGIDSNNSSSLDGKTIGSLKDSYQTKLMYDWMDSHPTIDVKLEIYDSHDELISDFLAGKMDAANLATEQVEGNWHPVIYLGYSDIYFGINKARPDIEKSLNSALKYINETSPHYNEILASKYFSQQEAVKKTLSITEKSWLTVHDTLSIGTVRGMLPFADENAETGEPEGIIRIIQDTILDDLGLRGKLKLKIVFYDSFSDLWAAHHEGLVDMAFPLYYDMYSAEISGISLSDTIINTMPTCLYYGAYNETSLDRIAVVSGSPSQYYAAANNPQSRIVSCKSFDDCIKAIKKGEATCIITNNANSAKLLNEEPSLHQMDATEHMPICVGASKNNTVPLRIINRAISLITNEEINEALTLYVAESSNYTAHQFLMENIAFVSILTAIMLAALVVTVAILISYLSNYRKRQENAREQAEALAIAKEKAEEASVAKSTFLFNMSHDIRTPMNAIIGYATMARNHMDDPAKVVDCLDKIDIADKHLLEIINQVLDMSRIESGKVLLEEQAVDVMEKGYSLVTIAEANARVRGVSLKIIFKSIRNKTVFMDSGRFDQIITNVLGNAVKYTKEGGTVTFTIEQLQSDKEDYAKYSFTIEDNGIGMSKDYLEHIYDSFSRERNTTMSGIEGTGLGMAIVKNLVELMGGSIDVQSTQGVGTTVRIVMDLKLAQIQAKQSLDEVVNSGSRLKGKRALLVEDNEMNREVAKDLLEDFGIEVETAEDGDIAVARIKDLLEVNEKLPFDFILMDIQMPRMDGLEAARQIRALPPLTMHVPIIAMTANAFAEDRQKSMEAGMDAHLAKPVDIKKLIDTLNELNI